MKFDQLDQDQNEYKKSLRNSVYPTSFPEEYTVYATFRMTGRNLQKPYKATLAAKYQFLTK